HLYTISRTLREVLGLPEPEPYDLINIRLSDYMVPYQYVSDYYLNEFEPQQPPYFMAEGYEPQFGDGFDIPDDSPEESVEGEGGGQTPENTSEEPPQGNTTEELPQQNTTEQPPQENTSEERTQQENTTEQPPQQNTEGYNGGGTGNQNPGGNMNDGTGQNYDQNTQNQTES